MLLMKRLFEKKLFSNKLFGKKKALLFGLNYTASEVGRLRGCVNDIKDMSVFLRGKGFEVEMYHDEDLDLVYGTTYDGIVRGIQRLAIASWKESLDAVVIHYSGHGYYIRDTSGDESDGYDECLCPTDMDSNGVITDDYLHELINSFNPKTRITVILDCCHSGSALDLPYCYKTSYDVVIEDKKCNVNVTMISGCRDNQTSADANFGTIYDKFSGALTKNLLDILKVQPNILPINLLDILHSTLKIQGFNQLPMISSSKRINDIKLF